MAIAYYSRCRDKFNIHIINKFSKMTEETKTTMLSMEELKGMAEGKTTDEYQAAMQAELDKFKEEVKGIADVEQLKEIETAVDAEQEKFDKYLTEVEYDLNTEGVEFEGKRYTQRDIAIKIAHHLNRVEQDFQYCLGLHGLVLFWKGRDQQKISYGVYDSTLRILGQLKYKGDSEWTDILVINNFMTKSHEPYIKDRTLMVTLAEMRNAVVDRIQLATKPEDMEQ